MSRGRSSSSKQLPRRTWVEIDCSALRHNVKAVQKLAGGAGIMAVVKANGYGHGLNEVSSALAPGVDVFAVATLGEALQLRLTEKTKPILLLSAALPEEYPQIAFHGFIPTISSLQEAHLFAKASPKGASIHFKVDTGMGRLGALPGEAETMLRKILSLRLSLHSISTHLSSADTDKAYTSAQLRQFEKVLKGLRSLAPGVPIHVLNSAGSILYPKHAQDLIRVGLVLYGVSPIKRFQKIFQPALSWRAAVTLIRELPKGHRVSYGGIYTAPRAIRAAVLPVGYADGYPRHLSGKNASVLIQGKRCPLLGRVTMDQILVDITKVKGVRVGDEAVLLGKQGRLEITATEVAEKAGTIPWHVFCGITARVAYEYIG